MADGRTVILSGVESTWGKHEGRVLAIFDGWVHYVALHPEEMRGSELRCRREACTLLGHKADWRHPAVEPFLDIEPMTRQEEIDALRRERSEDLAAIAATKPKRKPGRKPKVKAIESESEKILAAIEKFAPGMTPQQLKAILEKEKGEKDEDSPEN